uniref:Uncharacterized protein n=1 Tax=Glossina pallidipes TaxID=7398 RepID=A0A1B0AGU1_GLOPL
MGPPMPLKNPKAIAKYKCQGSLAIPCTNERKTSLAKANSICGSKLCTIHYLQHPYILSLIIKTTTPPTLKYSGSVLIMFVFLLLFTQNAWEGFFNCLILKVEPLGV